jgi:Tfp pilus assembly protein PilF
VKLRTGLALLALVACGPPSQGAQVQENVRTFKAEQRADRLVAAGKAFASVGDLTRAEQYFAAAIEAGGDDAKILPMLLSVCVQDGRYRVAITYAETYVRKHPDDVRVRFVLGTMYQGIGESARAKEELERVVDARPKEPQAHFALAVLMRDEGDRAAADRHFREYLRLAPQGAHAAEARASLLKSVPEEEERHDSP